MRIVSCFGILCWSACVVNADVKSGPAAGAEVPALRVYVVTGEVKEKEVDVAAERKDKPTIYLFVQAENWSRPMARFLKKLDDEITNVSDEARIVAVWLTEKPDDSKEYLPKAQMSLQFKNTTLAVFTGEKIGPKGWDVNVDAHLTAVVACKSKGAGSFGFMSVNETDVPTVRDELKKALGK
jgi:hypothetical protein